MQFIALIGGAMCGCSRRRIISAECPMSIIADMRAQRPSANCCYEQVQQTYKRGSLRALQRHLALTPSLRRLTLGSRLQPEATWPAGTQLHAVFAVPR